MRYAKVLALIPAFILCAAPALSPAAVDIDVAVNFAPPPIPIYDQPPLPAPGYLWTPGYWAWDGMDYYWVPGGTWILPPVNGMLWTPGYWGWRNGLYVWNTGYWGPEVGFYGGIDYGYGYTGSGFQGGYWHGGAFFYNRSVANFGRVHIVNVYSAPAPRWGRSRVSFNGGRGGLRAQPSERDRRAMNEHRGGLTAQQRDHQEHAQGMRDLHASQNGGRPQILTTQRPADFAHPGPGLHNHQTPRPSGGAMQFQGGQGQGARVEHQGAQSGGNSPATRGGPGRQAGGGAPQVPSQEPVQPRPQVQPHPQFPAHQQVQPHPQPQHTPASPNAQGPRGPTPQAQHQQGPRPQPQGGHEAGGREQGRREPGQPRDR